MGIDMKKLLIVFVFAVLSSTTFAQSNVNLIVLYESPPGERPAGFFDDFYTLDFDGDGWSDLTLMRENAQGNLESILVIDASHDELWRFQDVQTALSLTGQDVFVFEGFADPFGTGMPQALFSSSEDVLLVDPGDNSVSFRTLAPSILQGFTDVTGDDIGDIILFLSDTRQVQVWSKP